jgi:hypothetical protein
MINETSHLINTIISDSFIDNYFQREANYLSKIESKIYNKTIIINLRVKVINFLDK